SFGEVFQINLVDNANARRDQAKGLERLLAPLEELIALAVALELHLQVQLQRLGGTEKIDLDGVINHQIDRHQGLNDFRVATYLLDRAPHRRQIDDQRHTGKILKHDPRDHEWDLGVSRRFCIPIGQRFDVFAPNFSSIAIPQDRFQYYPDA